MAFELSNDIEKFRADFLPNLPVDVVDALDKGIEEMVASYIDKEVLKKGQVMPSFALTSAMGEAVISNELLIKGPLVISFYRGGWCPYCNLELRSLQNFLPDIKKHGGNLVAISPELPDNSLSTQEKNDLIFSVLSDANNAVAQSFGLVIGVPDSVVKLTKDVWDLDITEVNGTERHILPVPATYVVGQDGVVKYAFVNPNYTKRAEPAEILIALRKIHAIESN